jgi:hypothetical protein
VEARFFEAGGCECGIGVEGAKKEEGRGKIIVRSRVNRADQD